MKKIIPMIVMVLVACGGHTETPASNTPVTQLSTDQQKTLCSWIANLYGGYDSMLECDGGAGGPMGPKNESECVQQFQAGLSTNGTFSHCPATVGQVQTCLRWHVDNACTPSGSPLPSECSIVDGPRCSSG